LHLLKIKNIKMYTAATTNVGMRVSTNPHRETGGVLVVELLMIA